MHFRCASCVMREAKEQKTQSKKLWLQVLAPACRGKGSIYGEEEIE